MGSFDKYVPGAHFSFGSYPQSAGSEYKTPISWRILDRKGDNVFVISSYVLDKKDYVERDNGNVTWENSDIRKWLNNDFLNTAFTKEEQKRILYGNITTEGIKTEDKIFLLSKFSAEKYFASNDSRKALPTARIKTNMIFYDWLLRDLEKDSCSPTCWVNIVSYSGKIELTKMPSGVRPAMWISLSSVATPTKINTAINVSKSNSTEEEDLEVEEIDEEEPVSNVKSTKGDGAFAELKKGDIVCFGSYYQENGEEKTPIEWIVLRKKEDDNTLTLISKNVLDVVPFDTTKKQVKWGSSTVRQWLNNEFLNTAFTLEEQAKIVEKEAQTGENSQYGTEGEKPGPVDKICLFADIGVKKFFSTSTDRVVKPTPYAKAKGAICDSAEGNCYWWLRTPGFNQQYVCVVDMLGNINMFGEPALADFVGIRPFIWIKL